MYIHRNTRTCRHNPKKTTSLFKILAFRKQRVGSEDIISNNKYIDFLEIANVPPYKRQEPLIMDDILWVVVSEAYDVKKDI